jgi:hypothetical protein
MSRKSQITFLIIAGILIMLAILSIPLLNRSDSNIVQDSQPTNAYTDLFKHTIEELQSELQRTDISVEYRNFLEKKLISISTVATEWAEATPTNIEGVRLPDGIDNIPSGPFSESVFTTVNSWRKTTPDRYYLVYAGFLTRDAGQGAVYVLHPDISYFILYITPDRRGAVRVVEESGTTITLQSTEGVLFYFDAVHEQFVDAQGTPIPTSTPLPATPTPFNDSPSTPIPIYP